MIVEAIIEIIVGLFGVVADALGDLPAPGWLTDISGQLATLAGQLSTVGVWVPWGLMGDVMAAVFVCLGIAVAVRVVRVVLSLLTGGGGSAA